MLCSLQGNMQTMSFSLCGKHSKHPRKITEQHFQYTAQKVEYDKNLDTILAHSAQYFDQKLTPQYF